MNDKSLSSKEAALLAAARRELAAPADAPALPDIATRMAMLMDAELRERKNRKQRVKKIYVTMVATVMVPSFLYVTITIFKLLAR